MPPHIHLTINRAVATLKDALSMHDEISLLEKAEGGRLATFSYL